MGEQIRYMAAAPAPMELSDSSEMNKRHGLLAVNKSSGKIQKGIRRPVAPPRPQPTVYKIEPGHFRSLVQELTGTAPSEQPAPKPTGNARLQKFAPPPLRPTFSYAKPTMPNGMQLSTPNNGQRFNGMPFNGFGSSLSPLTQRITPFPMLSPHSFSPLPALSPNDQIWANSLESPSHIAMRQLAQSMAASESNLHQQQQHQVQQQQQQQQVQQQHQQQVQQQQQQQQQQQHRQQVQLQQQADSLRLDNVVNGAGASFRDLQGAFPPLSPSNFSLSPRFSSQYPNLPSPVGLGAMASGFGINIYNMGTLNSPTAGLAMDFSFPEPDFVSTGFS
ncbi:hypothetical protein MPTK1_8g09220 [Marchantia polymorpha subsp. ruderalis]|uniref:VQ domain-containing protein n=1 Tax=Marchantia polymorpha TaxID=3197 RepID=A0A2R6W2E3_MARPO|nr:hypothetical protein MARPO_0176s0005 [Marchantia polymorpha]BBN19269.1 hypothetical protein Mp_8g09220 [Marchantia polymorpha subsp. ruderalis]|eukprot:PTQ28021.1 hypothetical protein MARPO_0176s0005 [Marchantia polymorpha]